MSDIILTKRQVAELVRDAVRLAATVAIFAPDRPDTQKASRAARRVMRRFAGKVETTP
jgi:hypothetical protein